MTFFRSITTAIIVGLFVLIPCARAEQKPNIPEAAMGAIGEFLKAINVLGSGTKALPSGDPFVEKVRIRYEIPERVPILSPHGGSSILIFVYDSERIPLTENTWSEISPNDYIYLQTYHNLKAVYCLHEREPVDLGDIIIAVMPDGTKGMFVYFNDKKGFIEAARTSTGNSLFFANSRYIVKPVGVKF